MNKMRIFLGRANLLGEKAFIIERGPTPCIHIRPIIYLLFAL